MKKLNQVKVLMMALLVVLLATLLLACEEPVTTDPSKSEVQNVKQDVNGTLYSYSLRGAYNNPGSTDMGSWTQFQASGETDGEGMEWITISHYRSAEFEEDGTIKYKKDDFFIYVDEANTMYGTYDGFGQKENGHFTAEWVLTIIGGEGIFADAEGQLFEAVRLREGTDENPVYEVELSGTIFTRQIYF